MPAYGGVLNRKDNSSLCSSFLRVSCLMVSALDYGWNPGRGHCVVFLGNTLYFHSASLRPGV